MRKIFALAMVALLALTIASRRGRLRPEDSRDDDDETTPPVETDADGHHHDADTAMATDTTRCSTELRPR